MDHVWPLVRESWRKLPLAKQFSNFKSSSVLCCPDSLNTFTKSYAFSSELNDVLFLFFSSVRISNVKMDLTAHHALQFSLAEMIEFKQCKISFLAPSPIAAKAHNFRFSGCTLYGLNLDSLVELTGVDNQSE